MSKDKAIDWLKKSSEQGNLQAQNLLRNDRVANPRSSLPSLLVAPFGEEVAKDAQKDWARYLGRSVIETNAIGMRVVLIPPGEFMMGSLYSQEIRDADETPQHRTVISKPFFLGETQVSQNQWGLVMKTAPWRGKPGVRDGDDYPATYVSWVDAVEFCKRISEKDGRAYRLPSEAEWEYACRAGTRTAWSFGDTMEHLDHYSCSFKYAYQVRQKKPNPWALYDMHGNVWEWCNDRYDENYYKVSPTEDPPGPYGGTLRVLRGGSWNYAGYYTRSAARFKLPPRSRYDSLGFRVGYSLE
jgi:formylglycine-generating enzyme required for sulfatase activity